jgi:nicotinamidase/pyrazinamidase
MMNAIPPFYDPQRVGSLFYPELAAIADHAAAAGLSPATDDKRQIHLLIIDMQIDFCHPQGTLYVPGAEDDIRRLIGFIYRHAAQISKITCSLDSHLPLQIFHPAWWVDENGRHPDPFTVISAADVQAGRWRPRRSADWSVQYVHKLEEAAKKALVIWPYHVPLGGIGNGLDPELWSAVFWHSIARQVQPNWWTKGTTPEVEHYSILKPEVPRPEQPQDVKGQAFLAELEKEDMLLIAGEASSHCVLETVNDLVQAFADRPDMLNRFHILQDCMSPVIHPEIDFAALAQAEYERFAQMGVRFINSDHSL